MRLMLRLLLVVASLTVALVAIEVAARTMGYRPAVRRIVTLEPWAAFDPELGWTNRPNAHLPWSDGEAIFWNDASRRTRPVEKIRAQGVVLVLGCSYTQGFKVRDEDTFAWKLQQRFPQFDFRNFGTGGYGTYQSLLRFRRWTRERHRAPRLVVYGFGDFQGVRDRATQSWMSQLVQSRAFVPPHVDVVNGRPVEFPGRSIALSRWAQRSAAWNLVETEYTRTADFAPDNDALTTQVHQAVLKQLQREVTAAGSKLLVAELWISPDVRPSWREFFAKQRISIAECVVDRLPFRHPDLFWNARHADCIEQAIRAAGMLGE